MLVLMKRKTMVNATKKRTAKTRLTPNNGLKFDEPHKQYNSAPMADNGLLKSCTTVPKITVMAKAKPNICSMMTMIKYTFLLLPLDKVLPGKEHKSKSFGFFKITSDLAKLGSYNLFPFLIANVSIQTKMIK